MTTVNVPVGLLERAALMELATTKRTIAIQDELRALLASQPQASAAQAAPDERDAFTAEYDAIGARHTSTNREIALRMFRAGSAWQRAQSAPAGAVALTSSRIGRIYLAGPMTGIEHYNFPAFNAEASRLRALGYHVENPAEHGIVEGADWADYLRYDIGRLATCERIHLLPGWSKSKGARLEVHIAQSLGMHVWYAEGAENVPAHPAARHGQGDEVRRLREALAYAHKEAVYGLQHARSLIQASAALGRIAGNTDAALSAQQQEGKA